MVRTFAIAASIALATAGVASANPYHYGGGCHRGGGYPAGHVYGGVGLGYPRPVYYPSPYVVPQPVYPAPYLGAPYGGYGYGYAPVPYGPAAGVGFSNRNFSLWLGR